MKAVLVGLLVPFLASCSGAQDPLMGVKLATAASDASFARARSDAALEKALALETRLTAAEALLWANGEWAFIDPAAGPAYGIAKSNIVPVLVSFDSSTAVADGTRVKLNIGNLNAASFKGAELTIRYNKRSPTTGEEVDAWNASLRTTTAKISNTLQPGTWNTLLVSLPGIKPDDLGFMQVKVELDTVSLRPATDS